MMTLRPANERGLVNMGWLASRHSFSFGEYYDPRHMGFRALRVINDDVISGGTGFDMHPHRDMEIVTIVLEGAVAHKDSMGNTTTIYPGEVQRMSAGTGVLHSEYNASPDEPLHLLQIWLLPQAKGLAPSYEQKQFDVAKPGLYTLVHPNRADGAIGINQDVTISRAVLAPGGRQSLTLAPGRHAWLQVIAGPVTVDGQQLARGDGLAVSEHSQLELLASATKPADVLVFDLA